MADDKNLKLIETELKTMRRAAEASADFETADIINRAVDSALHVLFEYELSIAPADEDIPAGVPFPAAA